jgi:LuxR family transcriptional regulator, maltose regulon positive regulatory protein
MAADLDATSQRLIKTKLSIPQRRRSLVLRPRLFSLLSQGISRSLTLICAPAGYGKTTLLVDWIDCLHQKEEKDHPSICWLSLDEEDNDPALFLNYFIAAWENNNLLQGEESRALLLTLPALPIRSVMGALVNDLSNFTAPIWFVLDDFQYITNQTIQEGIAFFLDHLPAHVHLVIATRSDPPLALARLRARNQLVEIRANDLRFTPNEAADFLNQSMQLPLSKEDISTLEVRTEGWIAGLQMAAVAMEGLSRQTGAEPEAVSQGIPEPARLDLTKFVQGFSGSHRYILDYLSEEALNRQPADVQRFLAWTSLLDRFCAPLCEALIDDPRIPSREMLAYLDKANMFLIELDTQATIHGDQCWYRYHHLFTDLLRARLKQSQPAMIPQLHLRASIWFEQNGLVVEAVRHSLAAHDDERAAELIERYGPTRWSKSDTTIMMLTMHLEPEILIAHPKLGIYRAWILIASGQIPTAVLLLKDLKGTVSQKNLPLSSNWMSGCIDLFLVYASSPLNGNQQTPLPDLEAPEALLAFEAMPVEDTGLHNIADFLLAILLGRQGEIDRPAEILIHCIERDAAVKGTTAVPLAVPLLARTLLMQGRLHDAADLCQEYLKPVTQKGIEYFYNAGSIHIILGEVLREWNDLEEAEAQIREGIRVNETWQVTSSISLGYAALARVQETRGDFDGALDTLQKMEAMLADRTRPPDLEGELRALKIRLWLATGDLARAVAWADHFPIQQPIRPIEETDYLTAARVRLAEKNYPAAEHILEMLDQTPGIEKRVNRKIKIDLLIACALAGQNQMHQALQLLETYLSLAKREGHMRIFLDMGQPMKELLQVYLGLRTSDHQAYAQKLLDEFLTHRQDPTPGNQQPVLIEPLTNREREVLRLMGAGFSNHQIAENLILSEGTIKFHMHHILEKLEVRSRTAALVKAKELKLI